MVKSPLLVVVTLVVLGCGSGPGRVSTPQTPGAQQTSPASNIQSARSAQACSLSSYMSSSKLIAAYDSTAGALADWQARLLPGIAPGEHPANWWGAYPSSMYAALCFFAANSPGGYAIPCPPSNQPIRVCADRVAVGIGANGVEMELTFGMHDGWPPAGPPI